MRQRDAFSLLAFLLFPVFWGGLALGQTPREAGVVTALSGRAAVARPTLPVSIPLKFKDDLFFRDKINTAEDSIARVLLGGKALVTIRELSVFTITEEAGRSTVNMKRGKLALAVARQLMRPGEVIEVRTPNAIAAVRGTLLIVDVEPAPTAQLTPGPATTTTKFYVLKGSIEVFTSGAPTTPILLGKLKSLTITGVTAGLIQPISGALAAQLLQIAKAPPQHTDTPEEAQNQVVKDQQAKAAALAKVFTDDSVIAAESELTDGTGYPVIIITSCTVDCPIILIIPPDHEVRTPQTFSRIEMSGGLLTGTDPVTVTGATTAKASTTGGSTTNTISTPFNNLGTLDVQSGTLLLTGGGASSGSFTAQAGATLQFGGGTHALEAASSLAGAGSVVISNGTVNWNGASYRLEGTTSVTGGTLAVTGDLVSLGDGDTLSPTGIMLTGSDDGAVSVTESLVHLDAGGTLVSSSTSPLFSLDGVANLATASGKAVFDLTGSMTTTEVVTHPAGDVTLTLGTDQPIHSGTTTAPTPLAGPLLQTSGAILGNISPIQRVVKLDTALLEASAPLIDASSFSNLTLNGAAVELFQRAKLDTGIVSTTLVNLNNSMLTVNNGPLVSVAGGSFLNVTGSVVSLTNNSTLNLVNGPLVAVSGGSVFSLTGSFGSFGTTGNNAIILPITTSLTGFTVDPNIIPGFGVALGAGVSAAQVDTVTFTPFTGPGIGETNTVTPGGIVLQIDDAASRVRLCTTSC